MKRRKVLPPPPPPSMTSANTVVDSVAEDQQHTSSSSSNSSGPEAIPAQFQTPASVVLNPYWTLVPVPQPPLFHDLLFLKPAEPEPAPLSFPKEPVASDIDNGAIDRAVQRQIAARKHMDKCGTDGDKAAIAREQFVDAGKALHDAETARQDKVFAFASQHYTWEKQKEAAFAGVIDHRKRENERKVEILAHVQQGVQATKRNINATQRHVMDIELEKAAKQQSSKGVADALKLLESSTAVKTELNKVQSTIRSLTRPLKRHIVKGKNKYNKSGAFTKERRDERAKKARTYTRSGKYITDYQNPRFPAQRDAQLQEKAERLGVSVDVLQKATGVEQK